jgi:hypothetical protein
MGAKSADRFNGNETQEAKDRKDFQPKPVAKKEVKNP